MMAHATDILGYTFDADTYCSECTERMHPGSTDWQREGFDPADYTDSEGNEVHAYFRDLSESDVPEHCGSCGVFLENDLTSDGYMYVVAALRDVADGTPEVLRTWYDYYSDGFDSDDWQELAQTWVNVVLADPDYPQVEHMLSRLARKVEVERGPYGTILRALGTLQTAKVHSEGMTDDLPKE